MAEVSSVQLNKIIADPDGASELVKVADQLGREFSRQLTTTQIRAIFGEVRQIEAEWTMSETSRQHALRRLILLKPKMQYRARRERGQAVKDLVNILEPAVDLVIKEPSRPLQDQNFSHFVEFFEAILAYHKAYGGN